MTGVRALRSLAYTPWVWYIALPVGISGCGSNAIDEEEIDNNRYELIGEVKVAFLGDQGIGSSSYDVLYMIRDEGVEALIHLGDFDYQGDPDSWDDMLTAVLGPDFPVFAAIGNHDKNEWPTYQQTLKNRLSLVDEASCEGNLGVKSTCTWRGLFIILSGIGSLGSGHEVYLADQLSSSDATWRICAWHKNMRRMQVGGKEDETGWSIYESCRQGGAIVATGHEHSYSRTHLMDSFQNRTVASTSDPLVLENGKSFAFVAGLGGLSIRDQELDGPWWASIYTSDQDANHGALICTFRAGGVHDQASCYFMDIDGVIPDRFDVVSAVNSYPTICPWAAGHPDRCRDCGPCEVGIGDCDNDSECQSGLVCAYDVGEDYGYEYGIDVCVSPDCQWPVGHSNYCEDCGPCGDGEGDCDGDYECQSGLVCATDVGADHGYAPEVDVCVTPGCRWSRGDLNYCRDCGPCVQGEGNCQNDSECQSGLDCAVDVGADHGYAPDVDVCVTPKCPWPMGHSSYCRDCGPCRDGEGDCDNAGECESGLVCAADVGADYGYASEVDVCATEGCPWPLRRLPGVARRPQPKRKAEAKRAAAKKSGGKKKASGN